MSEFTKTIPNAVAPTNGHLEQRWRLTERSYGAAAARDGKVTVGRVTFSVESEKPIPPDAFARLAAIQQAIGDLVANLNGDIK